MPEDKNIPQIPKPPSISNNPPQVPKPPSPPEVGVGKVPIPPKTTNIGATPVKPLSGEIPQQSSVSIPQFASSVEQRLWEAEQAKRQMEIQLQELQRMLLEEREKLMMQTIKTKEEEALAAKVEESIRDIQERLRREKREQELLEEKEKLLKQIKELEDRLAKERETWIETLKTQLSQRDLQEQQIEQQYLLKIRDLETRWQEEKTKFQMVLRAKDEEINKIKNEYKILEDKLKADVERQISEYKFQYKSFESEIKHLKDIIEQKDKEIIALKSQISTVMSENNILREKNSYEIKKREEEISRLQNLINNIKIEMNVLKKDKEEKEKEFFILKTQLGMLQARHKVEVDKIIQQKNLEIKSKEQILENLQKDIQQKEQIVGELRKELLQKKINKK